MSRMLDLLAVPPLLSLEPPTEAHDIHLRLTDLGSVDGAVACAVSRLPLTQTVNLLS